VAASKIDGKTLEPAASLVRAQRELAGLPESTVGAVQGGIGSSTIRPDAVDKLTGRFAFTSDLGSDGCLWGATVRATVAAGIIRSVEVSAARLMPGVEAVLVAADIPGSPYCGIDLSDQAVLAGDRIRYWGEPIAIVAARSRSLAQAAAAAVVVTIEETPGAYSPDDAISNGDLYRELHWSRGDQDLRGEISVDGSYEVAMQDQAALGTESGIAIPGSDSSIDIYATTQWTHADVGQIAASLNVEPERIRVHSPGVGGAFGSREDLSIQIHLGLLAMATGEPVRMAYSRSESFAGHVHRHPARMHYRHESDRAGNLVRIEARLVFDGGAYSSTSGFVLGTAAAWAVGPYRCPSVRVDGYVTRTNNPPAGAMRGFGAVQVCVGYEAQMDALAHELGMDPVQLRLRNALGEGDALPVTGQVFAGKLAVRECLEEVASRPLPDIVGLPDGLDMPGGTGNTADPSRIVRGIGYAVGIKNAAFPEGFDDYSDARVAVTSTGVEVTTAAVEVGQGMVAALEQIVRTVLGTSEVRVRFAHTEEIGSAGSSSASRHTQVSGGAVFAAATDLKQQLEEAFGTSEIRSDGLYSSGRRGATLAEVAASPAAVAEARFRHPPTTAPDMDGQGDLHAEVMIAAHRAVVDVDVDLGLVRVVEIATAQDVGKILNRMSLLGQIEGGIAQGLGLALMEEIVTTQGRVENASFTDYLIPTIVDMPPVQAAMLEFPSHWGPFGAKGAAEAPTVSSPAAVLAAIRDATGRELWHVPVSADDIVGSSEPRDNREASLS
jgi:xanthine dehydrogenase D subunit